MNSGNGIQPTIELATTNGNNGFAYPFVPAYGYGNGNDGFFGWDGIWAIILLALLFGNGGWGGFGGFGGGFGGMYEFPWLLTGQQGINNNTNQGFDMFRKMTNNIGLQTTMYTLNLKFEVAKKVDNAPKESELNHA